jgi:hypothetical protein
MRAHYVYCYFDPSRPFRTAAEMPDFSAKFRALGEPFYIGMGKGTRCSDHLRECHRVSGPGYKYHFYHRLRKLLDAGITPEYRKLQTPLTRAEAALLKSQYVIDIGRRPAGPLCNHTDGGLGAPGLSPECAGRPSKRQFKGVRLTGSGYVANLYHGGARWRQGGFVTPEAAALAYNEMVDLHRGGRGRKNQVDLPPAVIEQAEQAMQQQRERWKAGCRSSECEQAAAERVARAVAYLNSEPPASYQ